MSTQFSVVVVVVRVGKVTYDLTLVLCYFFRRILLVSKKVIFWKKEKNLF